MSDDAAPRFDALLPAEMAQKAATVGVAKANMPALRMFALAVLAGAFISLGAAFSTATVAGSAGVLPYGVVRLLAGLTFSLGLIVVIVGGAELFTGNNLIVLAWAERRVTLGQMLRNWAIVYVGNLVGAVATAVLVFLSNQHVHGGGAVGAAMLTIAATKCQLDWSSAFFLGVLCNALVCLAVWLCFSARSTVDRVAAIVPPITAFVALGFEHSIANMYFIPVAWLVKVGGSDGFWASIGRSASDFPQITLGAGFLGNLIPVTCGNVVGGALLVGAVYWFIYGRPRQDSAR